MPQQHADPADRLARRLSEHVRLIVATSGGVDSCTLAFLADRAVDDVLAVTVRSEASARREIEDARSFCEKHGIRHRFVEHSELDDPDYVENDPTRCYHCRDGMLDALWPVAADEGVDRIAMGYTADDADGHAPGMQAAEENGAWLPYVEADVTKDQIRQIAKRHDLNVADRPSNACLSSRIPYGQTVTEEKLERIEQAEAIVREHADVRQVRVRHHGDVARIEVLPDDREALIDHAGPITTELKRLGFTFVAMDLIGYRTGALNELADTDD